MNVDPTFLDRSCTPLSSRTRSQHLNAVTAVLVAFKEHPDAWTRVDTILDNAQLLVTRFFALQVLESVINFRWKALPAEQRQGIRTYLVQKIIAVRPWPSSCHNFAAVIHVASAVIILRFHSAHPEPP